MRRSRRWFAQWWLVVALFALAAVLLAPHARATPLPDDEGAGEALVERVTGECDPDTAPPLQLPGQGGAGFFLTPPTDPPAATGPADPARLWSTSGAAGLWSFTWDLGCGTDPGAWGRMLQASADTAAANAVVDVAVSYTALTDSVERRAYDPSWITVVLVPFADQAAAVLRVEVFARFAGVGLIAAMLVLAWAGRRGLPGATAAGAAWAGLVLVLATLVLANPAAVGVGLQRAAQEAVSVLHGSPDPASGATERTVSAVHYTGWARRTFGDPGSPVALEHGPALLAATRWTHAETALVAGDPGRREAIEAEKAAALAATMQAIEREDPTAYRHVQGLAGDRSNVALLELGYSFAANTFRLFAVAVLALAVVSVVGVGLAWVFASPWLVTPAGEGLGRALLNAAGRSVWYLVAAVGASWAWSLWAQAAMGPGLPAWFSAFLLVVGLVLFWVLLSPVRKMLSLLSFGRVRSSGAAARWAGRTALSYLVSRQATTDALQHTTGHGGPGYSPLGSEDRPTVPLAPVALPAGGARPHPGRTVHEGVVVDHPTPRAPGSGVSVYSPDVYYTRGPRPEPPPMGARGDADVDLYTRSGS